MCTAVCAILPAKVIFEMIHAVSGGMLNPTHSLTHFTFVFCVTVPVVYLHLCLFVTDMLRDSHNLLKWFQRQLEPYRNLVKVIDLTSSWRNGLALCALIHLYRPSLLYDVLHSPTNLLA